MKKIIIGSDKSGFQLKEAVKAHLVEAGYEVTDAGSQSEENAMFYYEAAENVAPRVGGGEFEKGILICGTGMGMSIVANKHKGVYAAVCENTYAAEKSRAINNTVFTKREDIQQDCLAQQTEMFTTGVRSLAVTLLRQSTTPGTNV